MTKELVGSELPTSGSASLLKVKHCGIYAPLTPCLAPCNPLVSKQEPREHHAAACIFLAVAPSYVKGPDVLVKVAKKTKRSQQMTPKTIVDNPADAASRKMCPDNSGSTEDQKSLLMTATRVPLVVNSRATVPEKLALFFVCF